VNDPRQILLGAQAAAGLLPVCDHYSGVEVRMRKSLALQAEMIQEFGACVFDVTLDCEDGARVGAEHDHAQLVVALARAACEAPGATSGAARPRVAVRVHPVHHPVFGDEVRTIVAGAGRHLCHIMVPKVESVADVDRAAAIIDAVDDSGRSSLMPVHVLLESPAAVHRAFDIAAHPRVESISFGLMDFVSAHGGAIPATAMSQAGQFAHPLVVRAKLEIASACHAHGKVPSHCVVTEFRDEEVLARAARAAAQELGYTRMWSIHPAQIRTILAAMAPPRRDIDQAAEIIVAAQQADWAPIEFAGQLHDRASYRFFWQILERAHQTGQTLSPEVRLYFDAPAPSSVPPANRETRQ
jgi:citrate lyase subunit beta/citryl-CoA lyase